MEHWKEIKIIQLKIALIKSSSKDTTIKCKRRANKKQMTNYLLSVQFHWGKKICRKKNSEKNLRERKRESCSGEKKRVKEFAVMEILCSHARRYCVHAAGDLLDYEREWWALKRWEIPYRFNYSVMREGKIKPLFIQHSHYGEILIIWNLSLALVWFVMFFYFFSLKFGSIIFHKSEFSALSVEKIVSALFQKYSN